MTWAAIIQAIIALVGPLLSELIKKWLEDLLKETATGLGRPHEKDAIEQLLTAAIAKAAGQPVRRILLRRIRTMAVKCQSDILIGRTGRVAVTDFMDLADAAELANAE